MGVNVDVTRTKIYTEMSEEDRLLWFNLTKKKILPCIDNVYYTCFFKNDKNDNEIMQPLLSALEESKKVVLVSHESIDFFKGLQLMPYGFNVYKYCLSDPELYDIFIIDYLPNEETPRVLVQLRAYGLWVYGVEKMVLQSFEKVKTVFSVYTANKTAATRT